MAFSATTVRTGWLWAAIAARKRQQAFMGRGRAGGLAGGLAGGPPHSLTMLFRALDPHTVEASVDEHDRDQEESGRQDGGQSGVGLGQVHGQRNRQQSEQGGELDD